MTDGGGAPARRGELIAHRVGNDPQSVIAHAATVDLVEADVHWWRGRLEVRHAKRAWPSSRLWERHGLLPADTVVGGFDAVVQAAQDSGVGLWLDLKGVDRRVFHRVADQVEALGSFTVSTKSWWLLGRFGRHDQVRTFRSAGNRLELWLLRRLPSRVRWHGVVLHERLLTVELLAELNGRGWQVVSWGAKDRRRAAELLDWGVDGLIVDEGKLLIEIGVDQRGQQVG